MSYRYSFVSLMTMRNIDQAIINFDESSLLLMNICLSLIMFGVALDLTKDSFRQVFVKNPKALLAGLLAQLLVLPAITFLLILIIKPLPSIALGMILVASCPGGNISNFMTQQAGGNSALSIGLTSISSIAAIFFTPFNLAFYGELYEPTSAILQSINLDWLSVSCTIILIIIIPTILGMLLRHHNAALASSLKKPLSVLSFVIFVGFVLVALLSNFDIFMTYVLGIFLLVLLHNIVAFASGYSLARIFDLSLADTKSLTIETGIQNSGLGLLLIFGYFQGLGGMAIVTAWWGIWHIISGTSLSLLWRKKKEL